MRTCHFVSLFAALAGCGPRTTPQPSPRPSFPDAGTSESKGDFLATDAGDPDFIRSLALTRNFRLGTPKIAQPTPDGKVVLFLRSGARDPRQSLWEVDVTTNTEKEVLTPDAIAKGPEDLSPAEKARRERLRITASGFTAFELADDGMHVIVTLSGRAVLYDRSTRTFRILETGPGAVIDPRLSPSGKHLAYVRDNDLWMIDLTSDKKKPVAITKGGTEVVSHGLADFIAQEEFDRSRGYWWSPDESQLLYEEVDNSGVEAMSIVDLAHPEKMPHRPAYPRAGKVNAKLRLGLVSSRGGKTKWIDWDRDRYPYVIEVKWPQHGLPTVYVMDRLQQHAVLLAVNFLDGRTTQLLEEHDDAWINADNSVPRWLANGTFLWSSERSGFFQLELRDKTGKLVRELTQPNFAYRSVVGLDPGRGIAFVQGSFEPTESRVYALHLSDNRLEPITIGVSIKAMRFSKQFDVLTTEDVSVAGERTWSVRNTSASEAKIVATVPSAAEQPSSLREVSIERASVDEFRVGIVRPRNFDPSRKYPIVDSAYAGPHRNMVTSDAFNYARNAWIADATGAIVVTIDAKGTPARGREFERALKDNLASVPLDGHIAAIQALAAKHPEMDLKRVGVLGWSFGGYFASLAILKRPDIYRVGVAGAPVCDWRDYDTAYTERYLGLPDARGVYEKNAVQTFATPLQPGETQRPLLIAHGTADDNVFFNNSIKLTDALAKAKRTFEFMPLAGETHQLGDPGASEAFWTRAVTFLREHLARP